MSGGQQPENDRSKAPLRIGIWGAYRKPLADLPGCAAFIARMIEGWAASADRPHIVLVCRPEERDAWATRYGDCAEVVSLGETQSPQQHGTLRQALALWSGARDPLRRRLLQVRAFKRRWRRGGTRRLLHIGKQLLRQKPRGWQLAVALMAGGLPLILVALWLDQALTQIAYAALSIVRFPFEVMNGLVVRLQRKLAGAQPASALIAECRCACWLVLPPGVDGELPPTSVLIADDRATALFPEMRQPALADFARRQLTRHAAAATRCVTFSDFIRDQLFCETLQLPQTKADVVAPPSRSESRLTPSDVAQLRPWFLNRPYLLIPATGRHRPYRAQSALIEALARYDDRFGGAAVIDLVFTGFRGDCLAIEMTPIIERLGLTERVHFMADVDTRTHDGLYAGAVGALVIDDYEQGDAPLHAALHQGCPVACAENIERLPPFATLGAALPTFNLAELDDIASVFRQLVDQHDRLAEEQRRANAGVELRTWQNVTDDMLAICGDAAGTTAESSSVTSTLAAKPWASLTPIGAAPQGPPEVFLFLASFYRGGVWETTKDLVEGLVAINRQRRQLTLTLGVHENQTDIGALTKLGNELTIVRTVLDRIAGAAAGHEGGDFCFLKGAEEAALRADCWLALVDRFHLLLLPMRPYGIVVYDMIQRHFPEGFDRTFFRHMETGMRPTVRGADLILVTSPATRDDVLAEYGVDPQRVRLAPVACEPERRFRGLVAQPVALPSGSFVLNVANSAPHKGAAPLLRAHAALRRKLGDNCPFLVICGWKTDAFSHRHAPGDTFPYWVSIRRLVGELGLEEDRDVVFLGYVDDRQLLDLYRRCAFVVNAAKYDNGSFSVIEGRYFGRSVISSDYPASRFLCERFGLNARYFPVDDHERLAALLEETLAEKPRTGAELEQIRALLAAAELGPRRYAERIYDALVDLAERGRSMRGRGRSAA